MFPNLSDRNVVISGKSRLAFTITLESTDVYKTIVQNLGLAIVKKTTIKVSENKVMPIGRLQLLW